MEEKKRMRKSKTRNDNESSSSSKKKKERTPQRGLGVATLERLRAQENLKQMAQENIKQMVHQIPNFPLNLYPEHQHGSLMNNNNIVVPGIPFPPPFPSFEGINNNNSSNKAGQFCGDQGLFVQRVGGFNGFFPEKSCVGELVGFSGSVVKKNEGLNGISSTPSSLWGLSEKCGVCHQKKRVDDKSPNQSQQVEVVAVHRKGGPRGGGVMMEYEFFPEKGGRKSSSAAAGAGVGAGAGAGEEFVMSGRATGGGGGVESSSSIDLSLKLYY